MSADKMPPLPDGHLKTMVQGGCFFSTDMHAYARAYSAEQTRELVEALRYYANESFDGYGQPNGAVAHDAIAKHKVPA